MRHNRIIGPTGAARLLPSEVVLWQSRVTSLGGGFATNSVNIADTLILRMRGRSYYPKMVYMLPWLGIGIAAFRVPLIDTLNVGAATNNNFLDADCSQSAGIQANGTTKYLNTLIHSGQIGTGGNGGYGFWENNFASEWMIGNYPGASGLQLYGLWGGTSPSAAGGAWYGTTYISHTFSNGHFYTQRSATNSKKLFENGVLITHNTAAHTITEISSTPPKICVLGLVRHNGFVNYGKGRSACAYLTTGDFTDQEAADLHTDLNECLITPTGR